MMAAAKDERVGAVVADSPFASERKLVRSLLRKQIGTLALPVGALTECLLPYDPTGVEPLRDVAKIAPRATLFIHVALMRRAIQRTPRSSTRRRENPRGCGC